ncbi:MAG: DUF106 domain-containing protein [Candidatus Thorarchaeota archaeon]|nr:DUF106 domain-containing protein [Candidatus Thorarchaeota archaeon]
MQDVVAQLVDLVSQMGWSGVFVALISVSITTVSNLAMKRFSDIRRLRRYQAEIKQYQEDMKRAQQTQNEKLLRKVKRRKAYIDRIQKEMMGARCKPSLFFIIPFMLIFSLLSGFYAGRFVAVLPFDVGKALPFLVGFIGDHVPGGFGLYFYAFYFLVGLGLGQIIQRVQGVSLT